MEASEKIAGMIGAEIVETLLFIVTWLVCLELAPFLVQVVVIVWVLLGILTPFLIWYELVEEMDKLEIKL
jgi:hypothetical protein